MAIFNVHIVQESSFTSARIASYVTILAGILLSIISLANLGRNTRLGLPKEETELQNKGIYRISRNPMYVGFNLFTISAMLYTLNPYITMLGIYSIFIYHLIILGEERFLQERFGNAFSEYRKKTRRYI